MNQSIAILDRNIITPIAFIDSESNFYQIFPNGTTDALYDVKFEGNTVLHLGEPEDRNKPNLSRAIEGEYTAWNSLTELKIACQ